MGFFDIFKRKDKADSRTSTSSFSYTGGIRLEQAEVDIMFITKGDALLYLNDQSSHLFSFDKDGDRKLGGRVVRYIFTPQRGDSKVEMFVAFEEEDSYAMFTLQANLEGRLNFVTQAIFSFFESNRLTGVFEPGVPYSTQYQYAFKLYEKNSRYFMMNNSRSQAFLVDKYGISRGDTDSLITEFWGGEQEGEETNEVSVEEQPSIDKMLDEVAELIYQVVSSKIETKEVAYQFILEELEAASQGNQEAQAFVARNKFTADEYEGALQNSMPEVDGPGGPQQTLLTLLMQTGGAPEIMASIRIKVVQKIIDNWFVNEESPEDVNWDEVF
ncbi:hypothetical protein LL240_10575 [Oceanimonas baumannii]|uniref:hypothetical protein n=1 Tax=Oceanimonas baumannii TaxID=129578 RepID=UPI001D195442|nr:hypothetical protein [Oceanimonas baumannii]MCC4264894.1 hypothetical protein [Oceanimonas baumannii]